MSTSRDKTNRIADRIRRNLPDHLQYLVADLVAAARESAVDDKCFAARELILSELREVEMQRLLDLTRPRYEFLQDVLAEMRRLANGNIAPTKYKWDNERDPRFPHALALIREFGGWLSLARSAGLRTPQSK